MHLSQGHPKEQASFARVSGYVEQDGEQSQHQGFLRRRQRLRQQRRVLQNVSILMMKSQLRTLDLGRGAADIHSPQTTVREALSFSAHLRLGKDLGKTEVEGFIDQVRGMSKRCKLFHFYLSRSDPC